MQGSRFGVRSTEPCDPGRQKSKTALLIFLFNGCKWVCYWFHDPFRNAPTLATDPESDCQNKEHRLHGSGSKTANYLIGRSSDYFPDSRSSRYWPATNRRYASSADTRHQWPSVIWPRCGQSVALRVCCQRFTIGRERICEPGSFDSAVVSRGRISVARMPSVALRTCRRQGLAPLASVRHEDSRWWPSALAERED